MVVAEVAVDASAASDVIEIVCVGKREELEDAQVGLDELEPGWLGRCEGGVYPQLSKQSHETWMIVDVAEVVQDHEGVEQVWESLPASEDPAEAVGVDMIEAEELLGSLEPPICGSAPEGFACLGPCRPAHGLEFQGAPFVETHYRRALRAAPVEGADAFLSGRSQDRGTSSRSGSAVR